MGNSNFRDNRELKRYELNVDGTISFIDYIRNSRGVMYLTHTEVPYLMQGKGIGHEMVGMALKDIEKQNLTVIPTCSFVAVYIRQHPRWRKLIAPGITID